MSTVLLAVLIGFIIALLIVMIMKSQLKSVRMQQEARYYVKEGGLRLSDRRDIFLYKEVSKTPRPKNENNGAPGHRPGAPGRPGR